MGLIWLGVPEKSEFIPCVMWEALVLVAQMLYKKAVLWLDDHGITDKYVAGKSFLLSSEYPDNLQGELSPAAHSVRTQGKAAWSGSKPLTSI